MATHTTSACNTAMNSAGARPSSAARRGAMPEATARFCMGRSSMNVAIPPMNRESERKKGLSPPPKVLLPASLLLVSDTGPPRTLAVPSRCLSVQVGTAFAPSLSLVASSPLPVASCDAPSRSCPIPPFSLAAPLARGVVPSSCS